MVVGPQFQNFMSYCWAPGCTVPKAFSRLEMFQNTPRTFPRYGRCCVGGWRGDIHFEIWEVLFQDMGCAVLGGQKFRDMGGAVSRYGRGCVGGWEDKNFEIWEVLFRDMTDAVSRYGRCCFEIWEVLFRNMGGAKFAKAWI